MSCDTCSFSPPYKLGETLTFTVDITVWDENTNTYVGVDTLVGWDCKYILKQGDTILTFVLSDPEISILGNYTFVVAIPSTELTGIVAGKVEHEFSTTDTSDAIRIVFNDCFSVKTSLLWETS
jgi:hypothetical protein